MHSTVKQLHEGRVPDVPERLATVLRDLGGAVFVVEADGATLRARRAFSCLVEPREGDRVALSGADPRCAYVTAILSRPGAEGVHIRVDGDLVLEATRTVRVTSPDQLTLESGRVSLAAREASLRADEASLTGGVLRSRFGALRVVGKSLEMVLDHVAQACRSSFRTVETVEHLRAAHIDHAASSSLRLHAQHTLVTAEQLAKIDAGQIHLG
ncbi:DUF3540 domain-containing protein [Burkholderia sp. FERM BP-3421]|jgi:hypothetical protein|uniref:DUF3540 domain-containing protein n=1 Tax=Burkholderia sp. FERM BP-3421 TaxID=1494466 RepID=UPI002362B59B|nr:DUF3540 domain-containing protein [Burkholderia sp. FERM BP-3421]WDD91935.1 DUF3540 domain-containing protein [Burkholderia sp. FERM BP-3421]